MSAPRTWIEDAFYLDALERRLELFPDASNDEIADMVTSSAPPSHRWSHYDRRRLTEEIERRRGEPTVPRKPPRTGFLTQDQAIELYERYGSYRKAARASGYKPTHLRRKRLGLP